MKPSLLRWVREQPRLPLLGVPPERLDAIGDTSASYAAFVSALFDEIAHAEGKPLAGDKTPMYVRFLPTLHALFPEARIVHLIRDGRDVALSTLQWAHRDKGPGRFALWSDEPVAVAALWWRDLVSKGRQDGERIGPRLYHEVRYEQLVLEPEVVVRDLCSFMALPYATEVLAFHEGRRRSGPGLSAKKAWLPPTPGLRDWRAQMHARDRELFSAIAGDLLSSLGYDEGNLTSGPQIEQTAEWCEAWWAEEMARRRSARRGGAGKAGAA